MATALAAQLAQIRTHSTNSLDLKAQRNAHSRSLLFDSRVAASQDLDTIYDICYEGYKDMTRLDSRFLSFEGNIFSEQSKLEDRTQMTAAQNDQLNVVLEDFLSLVGAKLLLKPALKTVEWLVRRFRIHEYNTQCMVMTFLPYHTTPTFMSLLSILPEQIPPTLRFLHPYIKSKANPPRHTIVYTASNSRSFLSALSAHVLRSSRLGYQHSAMISLWASITTEAVGVMLDRARSARREARLQNQEDTIIFLLPILNDMLAIAGVAELRIGCYMILTVLASKTSLSDDILNALMDAVTSDWTETSHAGLICLAVMTQQRLENRLPSAVLNRVLALKALDDDLLFLKKQYKVDKLVLGIVLGIISRAKGASDGKDLRLLPRFFEARLMEYDSLTIAICSLHASLRDVKPDSKPSSEVQELMTDILVRLANSQSAGSQVQDIMKESDINLAQVEMGLQKVLTSGKDTLDSVMIDDSMEEPSSESARPDFDLLTSRIPTKTAYDVSFLSHSGSFVYDSLVEAFSGILFSPSSLERFSDLPVLRKSLAMTEPFFLSFFIRVWCSSDNPKARAAAFGVVSEYLKKETLKADVQVLLPYILYGLADPHPQVRLSARDLVLCVSSFYATCNLEGKLLADLPVLGHEQIYGSGEETTNVSWLSGKNVIRFIEDILIPGLEECLLDSDQVTQLVYEGLRGTKYKAAQGPRKELKSSSRLAVFAFLCSHVVNTPLLAVKLRLLRMLNRIEKVGSTSRTKLLLPLFSGLAQQNPSHFKASCDNEQVDCSQLLAEYAGVVTSNDREGMQILKAIVENPEQTEYQALKSIAFKRIGVLWPSFKVDLQLVLAEMLLDVALPGDQVSVDGIHEAESMETLRTLPLPTSILNTFLDKLPAISTDSPDKHPISKRRRMSLGQVANGSSNESLNIDLSIRRITLVLELIEQSKVEHRPELLKGLFRVLADVHHAPASISESTGYLQILAMEGILAALKSIEKPATVSFDSAAIRTDVLIDYIRTTTNPQVRNTALLLISNLAGFMPETILNSVMPVFTFMGSNILRHNDDFSAYVIKQIMESVIPRLVRSLQKRKGDTFGGVSEILLSFAAAFEHIPAQRRLDLYTLLMDKVNPEDYLFALLAIIMGKYPTNRRAIQFCIELAGRYPVLIQLKGVVEYVEVVLDAWKQKPTVSAILLLIEGNQGSESISMNMLPLISAILGSKTLTSETNRLLRAHAKDADAIRPLYSRLLELVFSMLDKSKNSERLNFLCMNTLDSVLNLLPTPDLIDTLGHLLGQREDNIRQQVLLSFETRLDKKLPDLADVRTSCLGFLPRLQSLIEQSANLKIKDTAMTCIDRIVEKYGKKDADGVMLCATMITGDHGALTGAVSLRVSAFLCLATIVEAVGEVFIPILPIAYSKAIHNLGESIGEETENARLHNAVFAFFETLLLNIPWMVTGSDLDRLLIASYESANAEMGEECDKARFAALSLIPKKVSAKECFAALDRTWTNAVTEGPIAAREHLGVLRLAIDQERKSVVSEQSDVLCGLFLKGFDLRRVQFSPRTDDSYEDGEVELVESAVNDAAIAMIYKLNDAKFRPMFSTMIDWVTTPVSKDTAKSKIFRRISVYKFLLTFFESLKSIVTNYASFIIEDAADVLNTVQSKDKESMQLWHIVLHTLRTTFEHDRDEFYQSPSHFQIISTALLAQLSHADQLPIALEVLPAIAGLAAATESATHYKEINTEILTYMRSDEAAVRLAAVQCELSLTNRLGEEWLALLPEMLPFINELQEDDDELVERETLRWIKRIEEILGESLGPMLQ